MQEKIITPDQLYTAHACCAYVNCTPKRLAVSLGFPRELPLKQITKGYVTRKEERAGTDILRFEVKDYDAIEPARAIHLGSATFTMGEEYLYEHYKPGMWIRPSMPWYLFKTHEGHDWSTANAEANRAKGIHNVEELSNRGGLTIPHDEPWVYYWLEVTGV